MCVLIDVEYSNSIIRAHPCNWGCIIKQVAVNASQAAVGRQDRGMDSQLKSHIAVDGS